MDKHRKITVVVPAAILEQAQAYTGMGITATVVAALQSLISAGAQKELLKLRGKVKFSMTAA